MGCGRTLALGAAATAACALVASVSAAEADSPTTAATAATARDLMPDLVQRSPYGLNGRTVRTATGLRFRLGFASAVYNAGRGPLEIVGTRPSRTTPTMTATQVVHRSDGSTRRVPNVGRIKFVRSETHRHWHLLGFERYELRRVDGNGREVRRDRKSGFCLGDRYDAYPQRGIRGQPLIGGYRGECEKNHPEVLRVHEGISVGYGDDYKPQVEGQFVDITGLPAGVYELLHSVNVDRRLREANPGNDAASIRIRLAWPRGPQAPPSLDVIARCGDGRRCR